MAKAESKPADRGLQLEVDELILDYVLYMAIQALLDDRNVRDADHGPPSSTAEVPLSMVNCETWARFNPPYLSICLRPAQLTFRCTNQATLVDKPRSAYGYA